MIDIDPHIRATVCDVLGPRYDDLVTVMLDLAVPPIFLFGDDRGRLVGAREAAVGALRSWFEADGDAAAALLEFVPNNLRVPDDAQSLLEAATWAPYFELRDDQFVPPSTEAPVLRALPELVERIDDDGLVNVAGLDARGQGLLVGDLAVHYHQLLRRGFRAHVHYELVENLLALTRDGECQARLAIDSDRMRSRAEYQEYFERDYWYGPSLSNGVLDDPLMTGETVHGDPERGQSILNPYVALSARWTADQEGLKTVELEELVPIRDGDRYVLARYLHAIRDISDRAFVHCDGAVKAYDPAGYPRTASDFPQRGKGRYYQKVFRLDGRFGADDWSLIAAQWFRGNRLILEYLAGLAAESSGDGGAGSRGPRFAGPT